MVPFNSKLKDYVDHVFLNCIRPKVIVGARLEFELANYDVAVLHVSRFIMKPPAFYFYMKHCQPLIFHISFSFNF